MRNLFKISFLGLSLSLSFLNQSYSEVVPRYKIEALAPQELSWDVFYGLRDNDVFQYGGHEYSHTDKALFESQMPSKLRGGLSSLLGKVTSKTTLGMNPTFKTSDYKNGDDYVTLTYRYVQTNALRSGAARMGLMERMPAYDLTFRVKLDDATKVVLNKNAEKFRANQEKLSQNIKSLGNDTSPENLYTVEQVDQVIENVKDYIQGKLMDGFNSGIFETKYFVQTGLLVKQTYDAYKDQLDQIAAMEEGHKKQKKLFVIYEHALRSRQAIDDAYDRESDNVKLGGQKTHISDSEEDGQDLSASSDSSYDSGSESESEDDLGASQDSLSSSMSSSTQTTQSSIPSQVVPGRDNLLAQIQAGKKLKDAQLRKLADKEDGTLVSVLARGLKQKYKGTDQENQDDSDQDWSDQED